MTKLSCFWPRRRAAAQLRHPNIVSVHEVGRADGCLFIVSDYVPGVTLADLLLVHGLSHEESGLFVCDPRRGRSNTPISAV